jgi:hypothetical protein
MLQLPVMIKVLGSPALILLRHGQLRTMDVPEEAQRPGKRDPRLPWVAPIIAVVIIYTAVKLFLPNRVRWIKYIPPRGRGGGPCPVDADLIGKET